MKMTGHCEVQDDKDLDEVAQEMREERVRGPILSLGG